MTSECTITNDRQCAKNICICSGHGYEAKDDLCTIHNADICVSCFVTHSLVNDKCIKNEFTIYQNSNYSGSVHHHSSSDSYLGGMEDRTSGFKKKVGASVGIHQDRSWKGWCTDLTRYEDIDFTDDNYDQSNDSNDWGWWNDKISSISIPSKCEGADKWTPSF